MKKNILKYNFLLFVIFIFSISVYSQDYTEKIMNIINNDSAYLYNLFVIPNVQTNNIQEIKECFNPIQKELFKENLISITKLPDGTFSEQSNSFSYSIYYSFTNERHICPLAIEQLTWIDDGIIPDSYDIVFTTNDFKNMFNNHSEEFTKVQEYIKKSEKDAKRTYDYSVQQVAEKISDIRPDYISFAKIVEYNHYEQQKDSSQFYAQASFPGGSLSISHNFIEDSEWIGLNSFGLLLGLRNDPVLSLHEYQNPVWIYGFFSLIKLDEFYIDLNIIRQNKYNNEDIDRVLPLFNYKETEINKPSGLITDVSFFGKIGSYDLPVLNLYMALGTRDYSNPVYFKDISSETRLAYWSSSQWQITTSFFWNTDSEGYNKFKFDFGAGYYDIYKALYNEENEVTAKIKDKKIPIQPVFKIKYIHDSEEAKFGTSITIFDNHLTFNAWLKLFEFGLSELRIEERYISEPYGRSVKPWENKSGSNFIQLIYRYGLNI